MNRHPISATTNPYPMIDHHVGVPTLSEESSDPCMKVHFPRWQSIREHLLENGVFNHDDPPWLLSPDPFLQIGRASCRERV